MAAGLHLQLKVLKCSRQATSEARTNRRFKSHTHTHAHTAKAIENAGCQREEGDRGRGVEG